MKKICLYPICCKCVRNASDQYHSFFYGTCAGHTQNTRIALGSPAIASLLQKEIRINIDGSFYKFENEIKTVFESHGNVSTSYIFMNFFLIGDSVLKHRVSAGLSSQSSLAFGYRLFAEFFH